jgi:hypothetical protein
MQPITNRASPKQIVHLSEAGVNAGRRLCLVPRDQTSLSVHAMYAPLDNPSFRENVCEKCLKTWAMEAYEEGDSMPDYISEARAAAMRTAIASLDSNASPGK